MPVVVTGAAGFIGRHLTEYLAARGQQVVGIDRRAGVPGAAQALKVDLAAPSAEAADALRSASAVYHLAARPGVRDSAPGIERLRYRDNVQATRNVCALVPLDVPLVVTSSSSVYGGASRSGRIVPSHENDPVAPRGGYARSKVQAEHVCAARLRAGGEVCIARPFTVVGEGQREDMALSRWIRATLEGATITVFGSPERVRDLSDVRGVVRSLVALAGVGMGRTVNVGTGRAHDLRTMIQTIFEATGRITDVEIVPAADEEVPSTLADVSMLRSLTGDVPRTDLADVVRRQLHEHAAMTASEVLA